MDNKIVFKGKLDVSKISKALKILNLSVGEYDADAQEKDLVVKFADNLNETQINKETLLLDPNSANSFLAVQQIVESYLSKNIDAVDFSKPFIEGESKKFYWFGENIALVELKPTMYSFTHNRYGTVSGTDDIRLDFWRLFATMLNQTTSRHIFGQKKDDLMEPVIETMLSKDYPFISNYIGEVRHHEKRYAVVRFANKIPPIEVIWKRYLVGTMKHNLKTVDEHETRKSTCILYEGKLPTDMIRFDWRNPLPHKDECLPDEFADFYINTEAARFVARAASRMLNRMLQEKGYGLVDLCYFMNYEGTMIHSEITPDGMRIKKKEASFDKDLWRQGKNQETIIRVWNELYEDLSKNY